MSTPPQEPQGPYGYPVQPYGQQPYVVPPIIINNSTSASASAASGPGVVVVRKRMSVGTHLLLTFLTGGLWAFTGWPYMAFRGR